MDAVFFSMPCIRRKPQAAGEKGEERAGGGAEESAAAFSQVIYWSVVAFST